MYALKLERISREAWRHDSKDMKQNLYFLAWLQEIFNRFFNAPNSLNYWKWYSEHNEFRASRHPNIMPVMEWYSCAHSPERRETLHFREEKFSDLCRKYVRFNRGNRLIIFLFTSRYRNWRLSEIKIASNEYVILDAPVQDLRIVRADECDHVFMSIWGREREKNRKHISSK